MAIGEQAICHKQSGPTNFERPSGVRAQSLYDSRSTCEIFRYGTEQDVKSVRARNLSKVSSEKGGTAMHK